METRVKDPNSPKLCSNSTTPFTTIYNIIYNGDNNYKILILLNYSQTQLLN